MATSLPYTRFRLQPPFVIDGRHYDPDHDILGSSLGMHHKLDKLYIFKDWPATVGRAARARSRARARAHVLYFHTSSMKV